jgi:Rrf2 family cysteine metabolism transcriptional repressor
MLRISTKGRYATRIMIYLALHKADGPARKREIAEAEGIPDDYVEQLLSRLRTAGLVKSRRGAKGGFLLARDPARITVADVLASTEGSMSLVSCIEEGCDRASTCVARPVWQEANDALMAVFSKKNIAGLARQAKRADKAGRLSFEI